MYFEERLPEILYVEIKSPLTQDGRYRGTSTPTGMAAVNDISGEEGGQGKSSNCQCQEDFFDAQGHCLLSLMMV
jgi:hypothetical protein